MMDDVANAGGPFHAETAIERQAQDFLFRAIGGRKVPWVRRWKIAIEGQIAAKGIEIAAGEDIECLEPMPKLVARTRADLTVDPQHEILLASTNIRRNIELA